MIIGVQVTSDRLYIYLVILSIAVFDWTSTRRKIVPIMGRATGPMLQKRFTFLKLAHHILVLGPTISCWTIQCLFRLQCLTAR
ncbi:hypothetical protein F5887DRAFT_987282 [Amanita rubescens]|nr:hypothetical protein F5887DRAFT_987282 [Amanita rubescens]